MPFLSFVALNMTAAAAIVIIIVVFVTLLLFRQPLRGAIERWNNPSTLTTNNEIAPLQSEPQRQPNFINLQPDSEESHARIDKLKAVLDNSSHTAEQKLNICLIDLANKDLRLEYEILFRTIYWSQYEALCALRREGPQPLKKFHEAFLLRVAAVYPEAPLEQHTNFEAWVGFLISREYPLIKLDGGVASITRNGSEFLRYVANCAPLQSRPPRGL